MPMVICVMALVIYFSFYLYGRCILSQDAYRLAFGASLEKDDALSPGAYLEEHMGTVIGRKYFGSFLPSFEATEEGKEITIMAQDTARHGAMGRYFLKPREGWEYGAKARARKRDYSRHIRKLKRLKDLGKEFLDLGE